MKKCPSCSAQCENSADVCPVCGHEFAASAPKRTMMGFPSLAAALEEAQREEPGEPAKQTLFGFPAQKAFSSEPEEPDAIDDDEGEGATSILAAGAFSYDSGAFPSAPKPAPEEEPPATIEQDLRGTVAGKPLRPTDMGSADATEIVSGAAVFPMRPADDSKDEIRQKGTLMGMSLADVQRVAPPPSSSSTQFAIPAVQGEKPADKTLETANLDTANLATDNLSVGTGLADESSEDEELPTQAWSPEALNLKNDTDGRKKLLEKIRRSRPADTPAPARPAEGGPDLSALKNLKPLRPPAQAEAEDERDTNEQVAAPRPEAPAKTSEPAKAAAPTAKSAQPRQSGPLMGAGGYGFGPGKQPPADEGLAESISDPEFGLMETDIASADLLTKAVSNLAAKGVDVDLPAPAPEPPQPVAPAPQPQRPAPTPAPVSAPTPAPTPAAPAPTLTPAAPAPGTPSQPSPAAAPLPPVQQRTQGRGVYETFDGPGAQSAAPQSPAPPAPLGQSAPQPGGPAAPWVPPTAPTAGTDDKLVRTIQTLFAILAGVVSLIAAGGTLVAGSPGAVGVLLTLIAGACGIGAIGVALGPLADRTRTMGFFGLALLLAVCFVLGIVANLGYFFLAVGLGAALAAAAGAFPQATRLF